MLVRTFFRLSWFWSICYFFSDVIIISDNCWSRQGSWELWCEIRSMMSKSNRGIWSLARPSGSTCPFLINLSNLETRAAVSTIMVQKTAIVDLSSDLKFQTEKFEKGYFEKRSLRRVGHFENVPIRKWPTSKMHQFEKSSLMRKGLFESDQFENNWLVRKSPFENGPLRNFRTGFLRQMFFHTKWTLRQIHLRQMFFKTNPFKTNGLKALWY